MRNVISSTPNVVGGALVMLRCWFRLHGNRQNLNFTVDAGALRRVEMVATECSHEGGSASLDIKCSMPCSFKCGWDVTALTGKQKELPPPRRPSYQGASKAVTTITITANEIAQCFLTVAAPRSMTFKGDSFAGPFYVKNLV
jgi:hypothetical protein